MTYFAVSHIDWSNNDLVTEFYEAATWKEALRKHSAYSGPEYTKDNDEWFADMPDDLEAAKQYAFDCDSMFEVVEVPTDIIKAAYDRGYAQACLECEEE